MFLIAVDSPASLKKVTLRNDLECSDNWDYYLNHLAILLYLIKAENLLEFLFYSRTLSDKKGNSLATCPIQLAGGVGGYLGLFLKERAFGALLGLCI